MLNVVAPALILPQMCGALSERGTQCGVALGPLGHASLRRGVGWISPVHRRPKTTEGSARPMRSVDSALPIVGETAQGTMRDLFGSQGYKHQTTISCRRRNRRRRAVQSSGEKRQRQDIQVCVCSSRHTRSNISPQWAGIRPRMLRSRRPHIRHSSRVAGHHNVSRVSSGRSKALAERILAQSVAAVTSGGTTAGPNQRAAWRDVCAFAICL